MRRLAPSLLLAAVAPAPVHAAATRAEFVRAGL